MYMYQMHLFFTLETVSLPPQVFPRARGCGACRGGSCTLDSSLGVGRTLFIWIVPAMTVTCCR